MNNKRLTISIISNIVSVGVALGVSFWLTPYLLNSLGKEAYSFYPLANNFVSYMTIVTSALNSMASRFITIEIVKNNMKKVHTYFSSLFYANIILSILLMIPMIFIIVCIDSILNVPENLVGDVQILFAGIFVAMIVNLLFSVFGIATFAKERMDWRAGREIGQNILRAVLYVVLFVWFRPTIIFLGIIAVIVAIMNGIVQYIFSRKLMPEYRVKVSEFDKRAVLELIKSGVWNSVNDLGSLLTMSVSTLLANMLLGAGKAGDLSIIQTVPTFLRTIISAIYGVLLARINVVYANGDNHRTVNYVKKTQKILGIICTVPATLIVAFGEYFFRLWVPAENAEYLQILSAITVFPLLIHSTMWTVYGLNVTNNKLKAPALFLILTGVISVFLSVWLIRYTNLGVYAITISSSICNGFYYLLFLPTYTAKKSR